MPEDLARLIEARDVLAGALHNWDAAVAAARGTVGLHATARALAIDTATATRWLDGAMPTRSSLTRSADGPQPSDRHGIATYRRGCTCPTCRAANTAQARRYRTKTTERP